MINRKTVIKELENYEPYARVFSNITITGSVVLDALALLREQEPIAPIERNGFYYCGECRYAFTVHRQKYCTDCGRAVKWE